MAQTGLAWLGVGYVSLVPAPKFSSSSLCCFFLFPSLFPLNLSFFLNLKHLSSLRLSFLHTAFSDLPFNQEKHCQDDGSKLAFLPSFLPIYLSIHPSIHLSIYPSIHLSIYRSIYPSIYLCLSMSIYVYLCLSMSIYVYLILSMSIYVYLCLSMFISVYVYMSVYLSIYLSMYVCMHGCMHAWMVWSGLVWSGLVWSGLVWYVCMSMFIYVYLCLSMFIYVYLCLSISIHFYLCLPISIYVYLYLSISERSYNTWHLHSDCTRTACTCTLFCSNAVFNRPSLAIRLQRFDFVSVFSCLFPSLCQSSS